MNAVSRRPSMTQAASRCALAAPALVAAGAVAMAAPTAAGMVAMVVPAAAAVGAVATAAPAAAATGAVAVAHVRAGKASPPPNPFFFFSFTNIEICTNYRATTLQ